MLEVNSTSLLVGRSGVNLLKEGTRYEHSVSANPFRDLGPKDAEPYRVELILMTNDPDDRHRFLALTMEWHDDHYERLGLHSVDTTVLVEALPPGALWKEIVLG